VLDEDALRRGQHRASDVFSLSPFLDSLIAAGVAQLHPKLAFDFAMSNLAAVNGKVDASSRGTFFHMLGSRSTDAAMIEKIITYANKNLAGGSRRCAATAVANITDRIRVRRERLPAIDAWLASSKASAE
jgi:hypothetical protein